MRHLKGLNDIRLLLLQPGVAQGVMEIDRLAELPPVSSSHIDESEAAQVGLRIVRGPHDTGDEAHEETLKAVRGKLEEIDERIQNAHTYGDRSREIELEDEKEKYLHFLKAAHSPSLQKDKLGRKRKLGDPVKKTQDRVRERVQYAVGAIRKEDSELADHLKRSIRFGRCVSYAPSSPVRWVCDPPV